MIPRLFEGNAPMAQVRDGNGIGYLVDIIRCIVTEERNGIYECEFDYPIDGVLFDEIKIGRMIACPNCEGVNANQPFDIYARSVPDLNGVVTFRAHHISYRLDDIVVMPFNTSGTTNYSCYNALWQMKNNSVPGSSFWFTTDKTNTAKFSVKTPRSFRSLLGGEEGSILDVYGKGEYFFNGYNVYLYTNRGTDSGVEIIYGKNLTGLEQDIDISDCYNAIVPYWSDDANTVTLPERIISYAEDGEYVDAAPMDLSSAFPEQPTVEELRAKAKARYEAGDSWLPNENLKIDFVHLWQTEEYKDFAPLQRVNLCDTVSVSYPELGIEKVKQKVVKVVWNVLLERYDSIELGSLQPSLGGSIRAQVLEEVTANSVTKSMMQAAIDYATELLRGGLGGYVVMTPGSNGYPQEILIMDTPDVNTAVNVIRMNKNGIGFSTNGYEGPFRSAWTIAGTFYADFITAGTMSANRVRTGLLTSTNGNTTWDLDTGVLTMESGSIDLGNGNFSVNDNGVLTMKRGSINLGSGKFAVTDEGALAATSGSIAGFAITPSSISNNNVALDSTSVSFRQSGNQVGRIRSFQKNYNWGLRFIVGSNDDVNAFSIYENEASIVPYTFFYDGIRVEESAIVAEDLSVLGDMSVAGTKPRLVQTPNYQDRLLYAYETPSPMFGDIGEAVLDEDGICYVDIDDIFSETVTATIEYQVFLQKEGEGDCWVSDKQPRFFVIQGTPMLKVAWELKARQRDYEMLRMEHHEKLLDEYVKRPDDELVNIERYINEQEELLYG